MGPSGATTLETPTTTAQVRRKSTGSGHRTETYGAPELKGQRPYTNICFRVASQAGPGALGCWIYRRVSRLSCACAFASCSMWVIPGMFVCTSCYQAPRALSPGESQVSQACGVLCAAHRSLSTIGTRGRVWGPEFIYLPELSARCLPGSLESRECRRHGVLCTLPYRPQKPQHHRNGGRV